MLQTQNALYFRHRVLNASDTKGLMLQTQSAKCFRHRVRNASNTPQSA